MRCKGGKPEDLPYRGITRVSRRKARVMEASGIAMRCSVRGLGEIVRWFAPLVVCLHILQSLFIRDSAVNGGK